MARAPSVPADNGDSPWLTSQQAAALLGIQRASLYSYVSRGQLLAHRQPGQRAHVYARADVQRLARERQSVRNPARLAQSTLDWGTPVLASAITQVLDGQLYYRGQLATRLAQTASLEQVAALLLGKNVLAAHAGSAQAATEIRANNVPIRTPTQALATWYHAAIEEPADDGVGRALALLHQMADAFTGQAVRRRGPVPEVDRPVHARLGSLWQLDDRGVDTVRQALVLSADHELNASSFAARVVASTGASLHTSVGAGLAALSGPMHGGMTAVIDRQWDEWRAGSAGSGLTNPPRRRLLADLGQRVGSVSCAGFGHPLYPAGDPRGRHLLALLPRDAARETLLRQVFDATGLAPSLDYALVAIQRSLGLPAGAAFALFALGRTAGWIAHAQEQRRSGQLIRPRAHYTGVPPRDREPEAPARSAGRIVRF